MTLEAYSHAPYYYVRAASCVSYRSPFWLSLIDQVGACGRVRSYDVAPVRLVTTVCRLGGELGVELVGWRCKAHVVFARRKVFFFCFSGWLV
jgi:hypothetical protein